MTAASKSIHMTKLRHELFRLYRACLKSAAKCPEAHHQETMAAYVRMKFRSNGQQGRGDPARILKQLVEGREELERMDFYHNAYSQVQEEKHMLEKKETASTHCSNCGEGFQLNARYCIYCGTKRV